VWVEAASLCIAMDVFYALVQLDAVSGFSALADAAISTVSKDVST